MIGKTFDDFTITDQIGKGGMGQVYLAEQQSLEREVAIKVIKIDSAFDSSELVERFLREAKITASIQHPNIVNIYKVGRWQDFFYIAMEYVDGNSLDVELQKQCFPELSTWQIALQICQGLQAALQKDVIHRDIKPANILLVQNNIAKLTDFGLSKRISDQSQLTQAGMILGSPSYMSPEQAAGKIASFHSDIYSLGTTIYHMLVGKTVFSGDSLVDILYKQKSEKPLAPQEQLPTLKQEGDYILAKMLNKNPEERYQSYGDLICDISALLNNQPLQHADHANALATYQYGPDFYKKNAGTKKRLISLFSNLTDTRQMNKVRPMVIWVTGLAVESGLPKLKNFQSHSVVSPTELRNYLQRRVALIVLDSKTLGADIVDFLYILKNEFADSSIAIVVDGIPKNIPQAIAKAFLALDAVKESQVSQALTKCLTDSFAATEISLKMILALGRHCEWSARLFIDADSENSGCIVFRQGKVVKAQRGDVEGKSALQELITESRSWQSQKRISRSGLNWQSSSQIFEKSSSESSSSLENSPDLIEDGQIRQSLAQPGDTDSEDTIVEPANNEMISAPESSFDYYMDEALDALLMKDYQKAYQNFSEAQKMCPDEPRVKLNLERLAAMGYSKTKEHQ